MTDPRPKTFDANYDKAKRSTREEKKVAKRLGGRTHGRSGGLPWSASDPTTACGDITTKDLHIEHKRAEPNTKSIGVTRRWLAKVAVGAKRRMKVPAMAFHFEEADGHAEDWLMLPLDVAERLLAALEED
jgi:hypothetical protein